MPKEKLYTINGRTQNRAAWAREYGVTPQSLYYLVEIKGLDILTALTKKRIPRSKTYLYRGESRTLPWLAERFNVNVSSLRYYLQKGYSVADALDKIRFKSIRPMEIPKGCKFPDCEHCTFSDCIAP